MTVDTRIIVAGSALAFYFILYPAIANGLHHLATKHLTAIYDTETAGKPRKGPKIKGNAVIAGGSWGGLIAARILSTHFEKVIVIEAEDLPAAEDQNYKFHRKNVPQYGQLHVLLQYGYYALTKLFPNNLAQEIKRSDGRILTGRSLGSNYVLKGGVIKTIPEESHPTLVLSRFAYEPLLRRLLKGSTSNVEFITGSVTGFDLSADKKRVTAVNYHEKDGPTKKVVAEFAVDSTGPAAAGIRWLKAHDLPTPKKIGYAPSITYMTITFPSNEKLRAIDFPNGAKWNEFDGMTLYANAADPFLQKKWGTYFQHMENNRLLVCFLMYGQKPPVKIETIDDFIDAAALDWPEFKTIGREFLAEARKQGEDVQMPKVFLPQCFKLDYAAIAETMPQNFVVTGDARCRVNPTYGQGMSKSTIDAVALDTILRKTDHLHCTTKYMKKQAALIDGMLEFTKAEDYAFDSTVPNENESRSHGAFIRFWIGNLVKAAHKNEKLGTLFFNVNFLMWPSTALFSPKVAYYVLKQAIFAS